MAHSIDGENPHTNAIAEFVSAFRFEKIPSEVLARIKLLVINSLGCAIYGADLPWSRILRENSCGGRYDRLGGGLGNRRPSVPAARSAHQWGPGPEL